jgi:hypothetical protein
MTLKEWAERHRLQGHNPHPAPTPENPERWECKCDPDAVWIAVWRILAPAQVRQKFAHLKQRPRLAYPDFPVPVRRRAACPCKSSTGIGLGVNMAEVDRACASWLCIWILAGTMDLNGGM